jgi:hypothetical protein
MKTSYLFPNRFKVVSGILFMVAFILLIALLGGGDGEYVINAKVFAVVSEGDAGDVLSIGTSQYFTWIQNSITDELVVLLLIVSGIVFAFSKEKHEDELVAAIRLKSLAWATIANYGILLLAYLFVYGLSFFSIILFAAFSQLVIFMVLFRINMYRFNKFATNEE